jgi:hypothetical protein
VYMTSGVLLVLVFLGMYLSASLPYSCTTTFYRYAYIYTPIYMDIHSQ